jgi:ubiquinone/menaquinone biosynthesis C-methylase UbiE
MKKVIDSPPPAGHDELQVRNKTWWEENPMTYDWARTLKLEPGTPEFYNAIDERFFRSSKPFGHPNYPADPPFARQVDYASVRGKKVLEIGCGAGAMAAAFAREGADITAIDITQTAVDFTRRRFDLFGLAGDIRRMDAEALEFPDNHFDRVWSWGVIHHSASMEKIIGEIRRVLKPGSKAQIMVYHRHSLRNWITAGLEQGLLRGKFLTMPYEEILRSVTDGYIARHLTRNQARQVFAIFKNVRLELTDMADLSFIPGNVQVEKYLVGRLIPRGLKRRWDDWLMSHFGWFLYIEAEK